MKRRLLGALLWLSVVPAALSARAEQSLFSGPQPGESLPPFKLLVINGAQAGREIDLVAEFGDAPILLIFAHYLDRNVIRTLWPCERFAADRAKAGLRTLFISLAPEKLAGEREMRAWMNSLAMEVAVGVALEGVEGPGSYGLNKQAAVTAIIARNRTVVANKTYVQGGYHAAVEIIGEAAALAGGEVPKPEDLLYGPSNAGRARPLPADMPPGFLYGPSRRPGPATVAAASVAPSMGSGMDRGTPGLSGPRPPQGVAEAIARAAGGSSPEESIRQAIADLRAWAGNLPERRRYLAQALASALQPTTTELGRAEITRLTEEMEK